MPSIQPIMHERLLTALYRYYPSTCTIQEATYTVDTVGEPQPAWADFLTDLPCRISPAGGREMKLPDQTYEVASHTINLGGYYPTITVVMRAVIDGATYDILSIEYDGNHFTTRLQAQVVT